MIRYIWSIPTFLFVLLFLTTCSRNNFLPVDFEGGDPVNEYVTIDMGTSIAWEAVKQEKPVLALEYLNANYTYIADFFKESEIKYRDQLYKTIESFIKNKNRKFYDEKDRQRFIKEIIDFPDKNSLERYHKFLKMCLNESIEKNRIKK